MKAVLVLSTVSLLTGLCINECAIAADKESAGCYQAVECHSVPVGSSAINSAQLSPYHAKWTQSLPQDGEWVETPGGFEERLVMGDDGHWKHMQIVGPDDESRVTGIRRLDRETLQVLDQTVEFKNRPDDHPVSLFLDLTGNEYAAEMVFPNGETRSGPANSLAMPMFDGQIFGVALAALPLEKGFVGSLPAVLAHTGASYWVEATVVGRQAIATADGNTQDVWEVATKWIDHDSGGVSEGGRNEAGGAYYIAISPESGVPHVIEYVNNGVSIVWDGVRRS